MNAPTMPLADDQSARIGRRFLDRGDAVAQLCARFDVVAAQVPGVQAMVAVDAGGEAIASWLETPGIDIDEVAAFAATFVILGEAAGKRTSSGALAHVVVALAASSLVVQPIVAGQGAVAALAAPDCDLEALAAELEFVAGRIWLAGRSGGASSATVPAGSADASSSPARRRFVRPFVMTGGRTESPVATDALVWQVLTPNSGITSEQIAVLHACQKPRSIEELAEAAELPLGVVRVVVADLMAAGLVAASLFDLPTSATELYPRIVEALEALV